MKTQVDFLSTEVDARRGVLLLDVPADIVLPMDGEEAKSLSFATALIDTLRKNQPDGLIYKIQIVGKGGQSDDIMRKMGDFVQKIVASDYAPRYLTIGYQNTSEAPEVQFIIEAVPE